MQYIFFGGGIPVGYMEMSYYAIQMDLEIMLYKTWQFYLSECQIDKYEWV